MNKTPLLLLMFINCCNIFAQSSSASRKPDRDDLLRIVEQTTNVFSEELYRRRICEEDKVPEYSLPPFTSKNRQEWERERERLLEKFKKEIYGKIPPPPDRLWTELLSEKTDALENMAIRKEIRIHCGMKNGKKFDFDMLLYVPKQTKVPPPVFVGLNFSGNQCYSPELDIALTRGPWAEASRWSASGAIPDSVRRKKLDAWNFQEAVRRGYAVATVCCGEIFPDNADGFRKSIFMLFYSPNELRPDYEVALPELKKRSKRNIGAIGAWAWGLSRILDALENEPLVNARKAAVIGHSRLGKAALWAGANDSRFALVISNNSGALGAALSKRCFGENLLQLWINRSYWFCENLVRYADNEAALPIDQHQLLALIAPRPLYVASSTEDVGADPKGEFMAIRAASEIWRLYGLYGIAPERLPSPDVPLGKDVRYHMKTGQHSITAWDWEQYYNFADQVMKRNNKKQIKQRDGVKSKSEAK